MNFLDLIGAYLDEDEMIIIEKDTFIQFNYNFLEINFSDEKILKIIGPEAKSLTFDQKYDKFYRITIYRFIKNFKTKNIIVANNLFDILPWEIQKIIIFNPDEWFAYISGAE